MLANTLRSEFKEIDQRFQQFKDAALAEITRLDQRITNTQQQAQAAIQALNTRVAALEAARPPTP